MYKIPITDNEASIQNPTLKITHFYLDFTDNIHLRLISALQHE